MSRFYSIMIFIIVYSCSPTSSKYMKSSQESDSGEGWSNTLDIHVAMQPDSTSLSLKSGINNDIRSIERDFGKGANISRAENRDEKSPVVARSTNDEKNILTELQAIEKSLRALQSEYNKNSINVDPELCLRKKTSLGVYYNKNILKNKTSYPKNCKEIQKNGNNITGIYEIFPTHSKAPFLVLCDMETKGGGWTHIQKRFDGSQDFSLEWRDYKFGFGDLEGEFWLGLENIYLLTGFEVSELLVEIVSRDNVFAYAHYTSFTIGPEPEGYPLKHLSGYNGDAGDSLTYNLGQKFSTKDLDFTDNCVSKYPGGWWYKTCHISNLNGKYINIDIPQKYVFQGLHWKTFKNHEYCHSKSRMLVRPVL